MSGPAWYEKATDGADMAVVRASAYGSCIRALSAALAGYEALEFSDDALTRMAEGNLHEPDILRRLGEEHGWHVLGPQAGVEEIVRLGPGKRSEIRVEADGPHKDQIYVRMPLLDNMLTGGHFDGVGRHGATREVRLVEAKAFGRNTADLYAKKGLAGFVRYQWQLSIYMLASGLPGLFIVKNRDNGKLFPPLMVDEPPFSYEQVQARAAMILAGAHPSRLPECSEKPYWDCDFRYLHVAKEDVAEIAVGEEFDRECALYRMLGAIESAAKSAKEEMRPAFLEMGSKKSDAYRVTVSWAKRDNYDFDQMRADGVDVDAYKQETRNRTVRVSPVNKKESVEA